MVVVTRWFGGTKLGAGGLVRAYGACAAEAIAAAGSETVWITRTFEVEVDYDDVGAVEAVLARHGGVVRDVVRHFEGRPRFVVQALDTGADSVVSALVEATGARAGDRAPRRRGGPALRSSRGTYRGPPVCRSPHPGSRTGHQGVRPDSERVTTRCRLRVAALPSTDTRLPVPRTGTVMALLRIRLALVLLIALVTVPGCPANPSPSPLP